MVSVNSTASSFLVKENHFDSNRMAGSVPVWKSTAGDADNLSSTNAEISLTESANPNIKPPSMSFGELLDVINPLQHLPLIGGVYRSMTGDEISPVAQIAGGTLYGGPIGGFISIIAAAMEEHTGKDMANAMVSEFKNHDIAYTIEEDDRMAGKKNTSTQPDSDDELTDHPITMASIQWYTPIEKHEPQLARVSSNSQTKWNFNG